MTTCARCAFRSETVSGTLDYFRGEPLEVGTDPQFLFDDHVVEDVWALKRVSQVAAKFTGNPVMVPDQVGEMCCYEAHVLRDPDDGRLRMWYQDSDVEAHYRDRAEPGSAEGHADFCRYAESEDGVHWHKPRLGLLRHRGTDAQQHCAGWRARVRSLRGGAQPGPGRPRAPLHHGLPGPAARRERRLPGLLGGRYPLARGADQSGHPGPLRQREHPGLGPRIRSLAVLHPADGARIRLPEPRAGGRSTRTGSTASDGTTAATWPWR